MNLQPRSRQRGISFFGLIFVMAVLAMAGVVAAQVFPTYMEYLAIQKAVQKASSGATVPEVRLIYEKSQAVEDIKSVGPKDLEVTKDGDKVVVKFAYDKIIHLAGPAYLLIKYAGQSK